MCMCGCACALGGTPPKRRLAAEFWDGGGGRQQTTGAQRRQCLKMFGNVLLVEQKRVTGDSVDVPGVRGGRVPPVSPSWLRVGILSKWRAKKRKR